MSPKKGVSSSNHSLPNRVITEEAIENSEVKDEERLEAELEEDEDGEPDSLSNKKGPEGLDFVDCEPSMNESIDPARKFE